MYVRQSVTYILDTHSPSSVPGLFEKYLNSTQPAVVDEWTLSQAMAADTASGGLNQLEDHYKTFIVSSPTLPVEDYILTFIIRRPRRISQRLPVPASTSCGFPYPGGPSRFRVTSLSFLEYAGRQYSFLLPPYSSDRPCHRRPDISSRLFNGRASMVSALMWISMLFLDRRTDGTTPDDSATQTSSLVPWATPMRRGPWITSGSSQSSSLNHSTGMSS